jgi:hypothetical protein
MRKFCLVFLSLLALSVNAWSTGGRETELGPVFRAVFGDDELFWDDFAFGWLGEAGPNNVRANGTVGYIIDPFNRVKIGAEFLNQRLRYQFASGNTHRWVNQWALGGQYQYLLCDPWIKSLDFDGYYSFANCKSLSHDRLPDTSRVCRRIAGSDAFGGSLGTTLYPWECGALSLGVGYDWVRYDKKFNHHRTVSGIGGIIGLQQQILDCLSLNLVGEFKRPYNYGEALLNWSCPVSCGILGVGLFGNHTDGKRKLPSSTSYGIQLTFTWDEQAGCQEFDCCPSEFAAWVRAPAVYRPIVLAVPEERVIHCTPPISTTIPNTIAAIAAAPFFYDVSPFFNGEGLPLMFSATGLPAWASIDPATGIITGSPEAPDGFFTVTVTGTTACSSTSQTFIIRVIG